MMKRIFLTLLLLSIVATAFADKRIVPGTDSLLLTTAGKLRVKNTALLGNNSALFQPGRDSTTFFQILDADGGTAIFNIDSTNEEVELPGLTASRLLSLGAGYAIANTDLVSWVTGTATEIDITDDGDGTITIGLVDPLIVSKGGTGIATITDHGVMLGSGTAAVTPTAVGTTGDVLTGNSGADPTFQTPTVDVPIVITMFDGVPSRGAESNWNGGLLKLDDAAAVNGGAPFVMTTKGSGKILIVINAGGDMVGDITATGTSVDRDDQSQTGGATSVLTLTGVTTDSSVADDGNSNVVHLFTKAYITDKWFTGVVTITTADTAITDMDVYHVSFDQFNDSSNIVLNTFDGNIFTTHVNAEFDAYLYTLHVTGDECNVHNESKLNIGTGTYATQASLANKYFRIREGNLAESLDGSTDGFWVDVHYSNSPVYVEDVTLKVWATRTITVDLN